MTIKPTSNATRDKKLLGTSASLLATSALLVVTRTLLGTSAVVFSGVDL